MTGDEPQGTMGRVQTVSPVVSFPPSFARTFSSKERRLGTRQPLLPFWDLKVTDLRGAVRGGPVHSSRLLKIVNHESRQLIFEFHGSREIT